MAALSDNVGLLFRIRADSSQATKEIGQTQTAVAGLGGGLSGLANPAAIATAVVAAVGAAAIATTRAVWDLTKSASEYGSEIYDASQRTGLSAQALSALRYAAETSGSSFDSITGSIAKFNVLLGEANQGNEKAQATLEKYNITARDTEGALAQAIKRIAEMTSADQQAAAAKALFKDRAGDVLSVIKSFDGDLPGLIGHLEKLGLVMSDEDARAADEFGDTLDTLKMQAAATGRQFAFELMPSITNAMAQISRSMAGSADVTREWGRVVGDAVSGAVIVWNTASRAIGSALDLIGFKALDTRSKIMLLLGALSPLLGVLAKINQTFGSVDTNYSEINLKDSVFSFPSGDIKVPSVGGGGGGRGGGAGKNDAERRATAEMQAQLELQKLTLDDLEDAYKKTMARVREEFKKTGDAVAFIEAANKANRELAAGLPAVLDALDAIERKLLKDPTTTQTEVLNKKQNDRRKALEEMGSEDVDENNDLIAASDQKLAEKRLAIARKLTDDLIAINDELQASYIEGEEAAWDKLIADQKGFLAEQNKLRVDAEQAVTRILTNERDRRLGLINDEYNARKKEIEDNVKDEEEKAKLLFELDELYKQKRLLSEEEFQKKLKEIQDKYAFGVEPGNDAEGYGPFGDLIRGWKEFVAQVKADGPTLTETMQAIGGLFVGAFQQMTQAIGGLIQNWVLMGTTGPAALRKILAATLAALAAEAGVRAIFELAMGFASLFWNPAEAAAHFKAAALFGVVAVGAAVAGRAAAGNLFQQQTSAATGSTASAGGSGERRGGSVYSSQKDSVIETGRNAPGRLGQFIKGKVELVLNTEGLFDVIGANVERNGKMRSIILEAAT